MALLIDSVAVRTERGRRPAWHRFLGGLALAVVLVLAASPAHAGEWYEDYLDGTRAVAEKRWDDAVRLLETALRKSPRASAKVRTYGTYYIEYVPQHYLGLAFLGKGERTKALEWLERADQDGEVKKTRQAEAFRAALEKARAGAAAPAAPANPVTPAERSAPPAPARATPATAEPVATLAVAPPAAHAMPRENPAFSAALKDAEAAVAARRLEDALALWEKARALDPDAYERAGADRRVAEASRTVMRAQQLTDEARSLAAAGKLADARARLDEVGRIYPGMKRAAEVAADLRRRETEAARTAAARATPTPAPAAPAAAAAAAAVPPAPTGTALRAALRLLLDGDTRQATSQLEALARGAGHADADVHGYLGVAYANSSLTSPDSDARLRAERDAVEQFRAALKLRPAFDLPERLFSPRIRELLARARAGG